MPAIRDDIKTGCSSTGHSLADLTREANIPYPRLSGAVNGYWCLNSVEDQRIRKILTKWRDDARKESNV